MTSTDPTSVRIRSYNVGFGDCFLLSFGYRDGKRRHVLIDIGSTRLPSRKGPKTMRQVAEQIRAECGGKLQVVVASHRHADHISGFAGASGSIIATLDPDLVVQPWTEEPDLAPDATAPRGRRQGSKVSRAAVARLTEMHDIARHVKREAERLAASRGAPRELIRELGFLGEENLLNRQAVLALQSLGRRHIYARFGTKLPVQRLLPGVRIEVLGPPTVKQYAAVATQAREDPDEFWHLAASAARKSGRGQGSGIFPGAPRTSRLPQEARWITPRIDRMHAEELLSIVRALDDAMNNTSLILLFEIGRTKLLFPGDAQLENWSYALRDAPNAARIRSRLASVRVYKVGHHGSLNATPKRLLWANLDRKGSGNAGGRLITMVSTLAGKHGSWRRGTEVPRKPLIEEMKRESELHTTQEGPTAKKFWLDVELTL